MFCKENQQPRENATYESSIFDESEQYKHIAKRKASVYLCRRARVQMDSCQKFACTPYSF